ncbi:MAG: hypothetical protein IPG50_33655 [Myxococcales bacterium]|nr:hypothetical protein [Myxococcales bacterium]
MYVPRPALLLVPILAPAFVLAACTPGSRAEPQAAASASGAVVKPAVSAAPPAASAASSGASAATPCAPWGGRGFAVKAGHQGGHGAFFRNFEYDDATGALSVHDSDLYDGSGKEVSPPRVTRRTIALAGADRDRVANALFAVCPDDAARRATCAPGGCSRLEVTPKVGGAAKFEHTPTVTPVMAAFEAFFPELRKR